MEEKKEVLKVVNEKDTLVRTLEGIAKVEYKYAEDPEFVTVMETPIEKGVVKNQDGKFPAADASKILQKQKVTISVSNNPFYPNRSFLFETQLKQKKLKGEGEKFKLEEKKMTKQEKQEYRDLVKAQRLANAIERFKP